MQSPRSRQKTGRAIKLASLRGNASRDDRRRGHPSTAILNIVTNAIDASEGARTTTGRDQDGLGRSRTSVARIEEVVDTGAGHRRRRRPRRSFHKIFASSKGAPPPPPQDCRSLKKSSASTAARSRSLSAWLQVRCFLIELPMAGTILKPRPGPRPRGRPWSTDLCTVWHGPLVFQCRLSLDVDLPLHFHQAHPSSTFN